MGRWKRGYALDLHTVSSIPIGENEYGYMQFETTRSPLGDLLYKLKYDQRPEAAVTIAASAAGFLRLWNPGIDIIAPVPPSIDRAIPPVLAIANELGRQLQLPVVTAVRAKRQAKELKNIYDLEERMRALEGLYEIVDGRTRGRRVLLLDDLYRSGATMNTITELLYEDGGAADVFALAITQTRSNR